MDKKVFIGPPDLESRIELLKLYMKDRPQDSIDWVSVAEDCPYYTSAELEHIVNEAARMALSGRRPITQNDLLNALKSNPQSLDADKIEQMKNSAE
jgi:SpoVK/Ycf46/Vps4 family AAA+-type ATPase